MTHQERTNLKKQAVEYTLSLINLDPDASNLVVRLLGSGNENISCNREALDFMAHSLMELGNVTSSQLPTRLKDQVIEAIEYDEGWT